MKVAHKVMKSIETTQSVKVTGKTSPRPEPYGMSIFISQGDEMTRNQQKRVKRSSRKVKGRGR